MTSPRRLLVWFLVLTATPAAGLAYMGWRFAEQDRAMERERSGRRHEEATTLIVTDLQQKLAATRQLLADPSQWSSLRAGGAAVIALGVRARLPEAPASLFEAGEPDEHQRGDYAAAIRTYQDLADHPDAAVRAGARLRLARTLRKAGQLSRALNALEPLSQQHDVAVADGLPADLVARAARIDLLAQLNRPAQQHREMQQLRDDFDAGRWSLDLATYTLYANTIDRWTDTGVSADSDVRRERIDEAVAHVWREWERVQYPATGFSGH